MGKKGKGKKGAAKRPIPPALRRSASAMSQTRGYSCDMGAFLRAANSGVPVKRALDRHCTKK